MPTHYAFKVTGESRIAAVESYLERIASGELEKIRAEQLARWDGSITDEDLQEISGMIDSLDGHGRWVEDGHMRSRERGKPQIPARVINSRTFNRNLSSMARFVALWE